MKKLLELFAGSCSVGKVAKEMGMDVISSDINNFIDIDYVVDILEFDFNALSGFVPDIIWASPPCTTFSIASCGTHWTEDRQPKTKEALLGIRFALQTNLIIDYYKTLNPNLLYYIENPRGLLRKMDFMKHHPLRYTVTYCQYGENRRKPTDIWTNNYNWNPRPMCSNGDPCHEAAPRGSRTGTQGLKGNYERSIIPKELCVEILEASLVEKQEDFWVDYMADKELRNDRMD